MSAEGTGRDVGLIVVTDDIPGVQMANVGPRLHDPRVSGGSVRLVRHLPPPVPGGGDGQPRGE